MIDKEITIYYGMLVIKKQNKYYCNGAFGRFVDELAKKFKKVYLVVPIKKVVSDDIQTDYRIVSENITIQELPEYSGYITALKQFSSIKKAILKHSEYWNGVVYIRWPVPFFKFVHKISKKKSLPVLFHLVGDTKAVVSNGNKYKGVIKWLAVKVAEHESRVMQRLLEVTPALVNGNGLKRLYNKNNQNIKEIRTSTISEREIEEPNVNFNNKTYKILYVGYLRHEKGLEYLLNAIKIMNEEDGIDLRLTIIGEGENRGELERLSNKLQINNIVEFKGYISLKDGLLNEYRENDVFVLPSISEGTPRVLIEAMSKGVPVIATNVGGIPYTIEDGYNGLLVPPKSSKELARSITKVLTDKNLRQALIHNGLIFAKANTLESHVEEVYDFIKNKCLNEESRILINRKTEKILRFFITSIPIHIIMLLTSLLPNSKPSNKIRGFLLRPFFKSAGKNLQIASGVVINLIKNVTVGDNVYIAHNAWINGAGGIDIEDDVIIGPFTVIATTEHVYDRGKYRNDISIIKPIVIEEGSWIASHVVINAGVRIGRGCLIGAGAVVTKDVKSYTMNGGVPSKLIKEMEYYEK